MFASTKASGFDSTSLKLESNTSILRFCPSSAAYKNSCPLLVAIANPVYVAPADDLSADSVAVLAPVALMPPTAGFHPLIVPSSVAKMKIDAADTCFPLIGLTPLPETPVLPGGVFEAPIPCGVPSPPATDGPLPTSPATVAVTVPPVL